MELKPYINTVESTSQALLIVPYGIETRIMGLSKKWSELLIVPYGIETDKRLVLVKLENRLLIVPYGIETSKSLILFAVPWRF